MTSWLTRSLSIALVLAAGATHAGPGLELSLERARAMLVKEDLGDGVYVFRAPEALEYWTATNSVVVVGDDEVVVFDSPTRAITARAVIEEIRGLTSKPVRILINSHWHQDHWSGNDEYAKAFPGLRIVASEKTRAYMSRMAPGFFVGSLGQIGLPQRRDELATTLRTGKLKDGSALDARVVVPGQGPAMHDKAYLRRTVELFAAVVGQVHAALASGRVRLEDVQAAVDVDRIGREYTPGAPLGENFRPWVAILTRKAMQEALDGAGVRWRARNPGERNN